MKHQCFWSVRDRCYKNRFETSIFLTRQKQDLEWNFPSSVLCFLIRFWTLYSILMRVTPYILHLEFFISSLLLWLSNCLYVWWNGFGYARVESHQIQKLIFCVSQKPSYSSKNPVWWFISHKGLTLGNFSLKIFTEILRHTSSRLGRGLLSSIIICMKKLLRSDWLR